MGVVSALLLTLAAAQPGDPIAAAFAGWQVEVEDDRPGGVLRVTAARDRCGKRPS
jgi:hypothetical protein